MEYAEHRFTLNLHSALSHTSLAIKKGDTKHRLIISLAEGGEPYAIADGCMAVFLALKPDNTTIFDSCSIEDNRVIYDVSPQTVAAGGMVMCEVRIYGPEQGLLSSESFVILVDDSGDRYEEGIPSTDEFSALTETLSKAVEIFEAWEKLKDNEILMNFANALDVYAHQGGGAGLPLIHEGGIESFSMMTVIGPGNSIPSGNINVPCVEKVQELIKEEAGYIDVTAEYEAALSGRKVSCAKEYLWTLGVGRWHLSEHFSNGDVYQRYYLHVLLGENGLKYRILADAQDALYIALYNDVAYDADPFIAIEGDTGRVLSAGEPCAPTDLTVKDGKIYLSDHLGAFGEGIVVPTGRGNIYIGSGDMPEGCNAQVDPEGEILDLASLMTEDEVERSIAEALEGFEPPESGCGIEVSGAVPGQFLKVAEVDENGVPTAWETAEMPTGGEWELLTEATTTEDVASIVQDIEKPGYFSELLLVATIPPESKGAFWYGSPSSGAMWTQFGDTDTAHTFTAVVRIALTPSNMLSVATHGWSSSSTCYTYQGRRSGDFRYVSALKMYTHNGAGTYKAGTTAKLYGRRIG